MKKDTIVAISTGQVPAGIAIIRLSGDSSVKIADSICKFSKPLYEASSHTVHFGKVMDAEEVVDEVLVSVLLAPHTYTGEDTVEINCHGSILIQKKILKLAIAAGARLANPGEYTMRAFLNGKLDLSRAEAVMDVISAENDLALKASMSSLSGNFSNIVKDIREKILYEIAYIESALDDPEHMSLDGFPEKLSGVISECTLRIDNLIKTSVLSGKIKEGIDCAIIGRVNVGKSSLLNALSGEDRAIVTDIPGTTRDTVEQRINMGEFTLNIIDTAGLRESDDVVESIGIEKSKKALENAALVLYVVDASKEFCNEDRDLISSLGEKNAIILLNKTDLEVATDADLVRAITDKPVVSVSAKELTGFSDLKTEIENIFFDGKMPGNDMLLSVNERHLALLKSAKESLFLVKNAIEDWMTEEIFAVDLTDAYESLGKILGLELEDDVVNEIFSKFCIGK